MLELIAAALMAKPPPLCVWNIGRTALVSPAARFKTIAPSRAPRFRSPSPHALGCFRA